MKILIHITILISLSLAANAQDNNPDANNPDVRTATAQGVINVPTFTTLTLNTNNVSTGFTSWDDMINGKIYAAALNLSVKSNVPWMIKVKSNTEYFVPPPGGSQHVAASLMSLRTITTSVFVPMSTTSQTLLISSNNNCVNSYPVDVKITSDWNSVGGNYNLGLNFTLTAQ